mmetsp:Transcript_32004/g.51687  ORF Transcript_32004/g.51687 Transcript_32004/m.51687 type:complete len:186 (+) Transcript_32004:426-983(+)
MLFSKFCGCEMNLVAVFCRIKALVAVYHIDTSRIIMGGISGGGSFSHAMAEATFPGLASILANVGRIWEMDYEVVSSQLYPSLLQRSGADKTRRLAAFLASPTDFRFEEMKRDRALLEKLGWETLWVEFTGGHMGAPDDVYARALDWMLTSERWTSSGLSNFESNLDTASQLYAIYKTWDPPVIS